MFYKLCFICHIIFYCNIKEPLFSPIFTYGIYIYIYIYTVIASKVIYQCLVPISVAWYIFHLLLRTEISRRWINTQKILSTICSNKNMNTNAGSKFHKFQMHYFPLILFTLCAITTCCNKLVFKEEEKSHILLLFLWHIMCSAIN